MFVFAEKVLKKKTLGIGDKTKGTNFMLKSNVIALPWGVLRQSSETGEYYYEKWIFTGY